MKHNSVLLEQARETIRFYQYKATPEGSDSEEPALQTSSKRLRDKNKINLQRTEDTRREY